MSENFIDKVDFIRKRFENFSNFIELENFREFLLFTLTTQVSMNILAQIGLGGEKDVINLPYDPESEIYFQKISLISSDPLIIYTRSPLISEKFVLSKDDPIFKQYLDVNEMELAFRGKEKFIFPKVSDCTFLEKNKLKIKIDDFYHSIESFISFSQPNVLFIIDAQDDTMPDLIFSFNLLPQFPTKSNENTLKIDACLDYDHKTQGITYIKRKEDYSLEFLKNIKEVSHAELYKSSFSLILHVKSLNAPK